MNSELAISDARHARKRALFPTWKRRLPLIFLLSMLLVALVIEPLRYGELLWLPKVPLALLLAWALSRPTGR